MVKRLSLILIVFVHSTILCAAPISVTELRLKFYLAVDNGSKAKEYLKELEKISIVSPDPIVLGYKAAVCMVMAKHTYNPYNKFKYFIEGKNDLEASIKKSPDHVELRLIRFAIQTNAPFFLGYNGNIQSDKSFLISHLGNIADTELKKHIKNYLHESGKCSKEELERINKI